MLPLATPSNMEAGSSCSLLELPAELRNITWTLSSTHDDLYIDLVTAKGVSTALLSTCSQIYSDAIAVLKKVNSQYWTTGRFEISGDTSDESIDSLIKKRLQVNCLKISGRRE
jgi:hypothetical protein